MAKDTKTKSDIVSKLKELFALANENEEKRNLKFIDQKLNNGNLITTSDPAFIVGSKVQLKTSDGTVSDIPDGTYTLDADGTEIVIKGGVIESLTPKDTTAPTDEPLEDDMAKKKPDPSIEIQNEGDAAPDMNMVVKVLSDLSSRIAALEKNAGDAQKMKSEFDAFKAAPAGKNIGKVVFTKPNDPDDFLKQVRNENEAAMNKFKEMDKESKELFKRPAKTENKKTPKINFGGQFSMSN